MLASAELIQYFVFIFFHGGLNKKWGLYCWQVGECKGVDLIGLLGDIKEDLGSGDGSPPEAEAFFVKLDIIFALKYNKQQLWLLLDKINL